MFQSSRMLAHVHVLVVGAVLFLGIADANPFFDAGEASDMTQRLQNLREGETRGTSLGTVTCLDDALPGTDHLTVKIPQIGDMFQAQTRGNQVSLFIRKTLDYENTEDQNTLFLTITCTGTESEYEAKLDMKIVMSDVNDEVPVFTKADAFRFTLAETVIDLDIPVFGGIIVEDGDGTEINSDIVPFCKNVLLKGVIVPCDGYFSLDVIQLNTGRYEFQMYAMRRDYKESDTYVVTIRADNTALGPDGKPVTSKEKNINIDVKDLQDSDPRFDPRSLLKTVSEDHTVFTVVGTPVEAFDQDYRDPNDLTFNLKRFDEDPAGFDNGYFEIGDIVPRTNNKSQVIWYADIMLVKPLDREEITNVFDTLYLYIEAVEVIPAGINTPGRGTQSASSLLAIRVTDVNDEGPVFIPDTYDVVVQEYGNIQPDEKTDREQIQAEITVTDNDGAKNNLFDVEFLSGNERGLFHLSGYSGVGTAQFILYAEKSLLDYEANVNNNFRLTLLARDTSNPLFTSTAVINVEVTDENDNRPTFSQESYEFSTKEDSPNGTLIGQVLATDKDQGDSITYRVVSSDGKFRVDQSGNIYLEGSVDYEDQRFHLIQVVAIDSGGLEEQVSVRINIENVLDGDLRFPAQTYVAEYYEETLILRPSITLSADSPEEALSVTYGIEKVEPPALARNFRVDPNTGELEVVEDINYEMTNNGSVTLTFFARAGTLYSRTTGVITVRDFNNFAPQFLPSGTTLFEVSISEISKPGDVVFITTATDADNSNPEFSRITFSILQEGPDHFTIDPITGVITTKATLDIDNIPSYRITIQATDNGTPVLYSEVSLIINLTPANNKPPVFKNLLVITTASEDDAFGTPIAQVTATDPDQSNRIEYRLDFSKAFFEGEGRNVTGSVDGNNFFRVNKNDGVLSVTDQLDRNIFIRANFRIAAEDMAALTDGQVAYVDVRVTISAAAETEIYFLTSRGREQNPTFTKDYQETKALSGASDIFFLRAIDPVVSKDVNNFVEDTNYDPDNYFSVKDDGSVSLRRELDYEQLDASKQIMTVVMAISADKLRTSTATLIVNVIDVNDNEPKFQKDSYIFSISENANSQEIIGRVTATDADSTSYAQITYALSGQNQGDFAVYDTVSGSQSVAEIRINDGSFLDYETTRMYNLQLLAMDYPTGRESDKRRSEVPLTILVTDVNDNPPIFQERIYRFSIIGNSKMNFTVGILRATDLDAGAFGTVEYFIKSASDRGASYFGIDTVAAKSANEKLNLGRLYVLSSLEDLPDNFMFFMTVEARDNINGQVSLVGNCSVEITIDKGVSDPMPKWLTGLNTTVSILENSTIGTFVTQLIARPANRTSGIRYEFVTGGNNDYAKFQIDVNTGVITVAGNLDYETNKVYSLLIKAIDTSNANYTNQFLLVINIIDVDDNDPKFPCPGQLHQIPEKTYVRENLEEAEFEPQFVYQARACDLDTEAYHDMIYSWYYDDTVCKRSTSNTFSLDGITGKIYTKDKLDREKVPEYLLCVQVDPRPRRRKRQTIASQVPEIQARKVPSHERVQYVWVIVQDVNDNGPTFPYDKLILQTAILEYPERVNFARVEAFDPDNAPNNQPRYSIDDIQFVTRGKNHSQPAAFLINGNDGTIYTTQPQYSDFVGGHFDTTIRASDSFNGNMFSRILYRIFVTKKENLFRVVFNEPAGVDVNQKVNNMVKELNDLDRMHYQIHRISYHIVSNDQDPSFEKTDVCMIAIKKDYVLSASEAAKELNVDEENVIISKYGARDPGPCEPAKSVYPEGWESYWWVLVAFAIFIFIAVCILIILTCVLYKQYRNYMDTRQTYLVPGGGYD